MTNYFKGNERLETFPATGAMIRMGETDQLNVPDFVILRELISSHQWEKSLSYLEVFYAQNTGMIGLLVDWCTSMPKLYAELTSSDSEEKLRVQAIADYQNHVDQFSSKFSSVDDKNILVLARQFFSHENLQTVTAASLLSELEKSYTLLKNSLVSKDEKAALDLVTPYHHRALLFHDALIAYTYTYPTAVMKVSGEKTGIEVCNGSIMKNVLWNGMWELTRVLTPLDLAAFLAEHLRSHFSGLDRLGQTTVIEDDEKIRLVFDPCGSGGALRRRLQDDIYKLKEEHQLGWNKCNAVNIYCTHCALNEKKSIDMFGYPKLVVEFQEDPNKPCGWTMYKNPEDVPAEVYTRLGLKK